MENRIEKVDNEEVLKGAVSRWLVGRIEAFREEMGECGENGRWITGNVEWLMIVWYVYRRCLRAEVEILTINRPIEHKVYVGV